MEESSNKDYRTMKNFLSNRFSSLSKEINFLGLNYEKNRHLWKIIEKYNELNDSTKVTEFMFKLVFTVDYSEDSYLVCRNV